MTEQSQRSADAEPEVLPPLQAGALFARFLRFGFLAWGGPVAQIAMLRRELVDEELWVSSRRFNRLLYWEQGMEKPEQEDIFNFN